MVQARRQSQMASQTSVPEPCEWSSRSTPGTSAVRACGPITACRAPRQAPHATAWSQTEAACSDICRTDEQVRRFSCVGGTRQHGGDRHRRCRGSNAASSLQMAVRKSPCAPSQRSPNVRSGRVSGNVCRGSGYGAGTHHQGVPSAGKIGGRDVVQRIRRDAHSAMLVANPSVASRRSGQARGRWPTPVGMDFRYARAATVGHLASILSQNPWRSPARPLLS